MLPCVALSNPAIKRRDVVLPQPEGPSIVVSVPGSKEQDILSTAVVSLNFFVTSINLTYDFFINPYSHAKKYHLDHVVLTFFYRLIIE